jgi:hypothetical protein
MHEVDPQSEDRTEARLAEALRRMAAASHRGAPQELGAGLTAAFRRHHARRRRVRHIRIGLLALVIGAIAAAISLRQASQGPSGLAKEAPAKGSDIAVTAPPRTPEPAPAAKTATAKAPARRRPASATTSIAANRPFLALPGYDPLVPPDQLHVVRVQLPASELRQMGAPISANYATRRMTADVVLSQGGTPYAVRLVQ